MTELTLNEILFKDSPINTNPASEEVNQFTKEVSNFLIKTDYFNWILNMSHGYHNEYSTWLTDTEAMGGDVIAIKKDDTITFKHKKGHGWHNIMIVTSQILNQAISGYLLTGSETMKEVINQYCKGITATMKGMHWSENDPNPYLMARNIIPENHDYEINGKKKFIDYSEWRTIKEHWNTKRIHNSNNPYYGDIYVTNTRSKDDLPWIFRTAALLPHLINKSVDEKIIITAKETMQYLQGFCKDIVNNDYHIRTKDEKGKPYTPKGDLASFTNYDFLGYESEANAKLTISLIAGENDNEIKVGNGYNKLFEKIATRSHYFNYRIINGFHMTAILHSLNNNQYKITEELLEGLIKRADHLMKGKGHKSGMKNPRWHPDLAVFLLQAGSVGMPLKKEQVNLIQTEFSKAIKEYNKFNRWDLWNESVPNGLYGPSGGYKPKSEGLIRPEKIGLILEYCFSPYKNGERLVNNKMLKNLLKPL